ncbi:MAG TPA: PQQ-dependent sugar dehydrogenase [Cyclobacteriaceae bacterium]|nr:PQQ-dependent sugar dehydrogenase [Cyclobacteriaceae bacterium]
MIKRSGRSCILLFTLLLSTCTEKQSKESLPDSKPEENRFTSVIVTAPGSLNEPMVFEVLDDESVLIIERGGVLKKWDAQTTTMKTIYQIPVFTHSEQGLVGMTIDPNFNTNHWIYLYYADASISKFFLTRWDLVNDSLIASSKKILLEVPSDREDTSHTGGGMTWDAQGNLFLTIGNNTGNSLFSQTDERPDRIQFDDQRGAANTNDFRGKILRIHPEPDGTYSIPDGNLFPKGKAGTRPEIYVMGNRNPWRVSVDSKTEFLYWGEVGPDADSDSEKGPMGYDELNQAKQAGFFGWPYFIGENYGYPMYDFITNTLGPVQDPAKPVNKSRNNTGLTELPPAQPAFISYPYRPSEKFPLVGSSSRCAIGGPIFHRSDFKNPVRPFPSYFEGKWLAADLSRFWIMAITIDEQGNYVGMERFAPNYHPRQPIDIKFGPTGDLYVLEYGGNTANSPVESQLVRIEYNAGNRKPVVQIKSDKRGGSIPLTVQLSSEGTVDYDGDELSYEWKISSGNQTFNSKERDPQFTLDQAGIYTASLTITDSKKLTNTASVQIVAGNDPPKVELVIRGNQSFFFSGERETYKTIVSDNEDGSLEGKNIKPEEVAISIDYLSEGFDYPAIAVLQSELSRFAVAKSLMAQSDCRTCHNEKEKGIGPSFSQIAERYNQNSKATEILVDKIRNGSAGTWNLETAMPAHPTITPANAQVIINYILNHEKKTGLPVTGEFNFKIPGQDKGTGSFILRAAYADKGNDDLPSLASESVIILKSSKLIPVNAEIQQGTIRDQLDEYTFLTARPNSFIAFNNLDLTGINQISFQPNWHLYDIYVGGKIEVRLDSENGELVGETELMPNQFNVRFRGAFAPPPGSAEKAVPLDKTLPPLDMSKFFGPGSDKSSFTIPSVIKLKKEINEFHTIYFVFKNDKAKPEESLFPLSSIEFKR